MEKAKVYIQKMVIPTYEVGKPDKNPMFFEKRVYQGSSGKVYPNPVIEKIYDNKVDKEYNAVILENKWLYVVVLPELGGRIYTAYDKTNNYDFVYHNRVIKPALVGLLGPWISGGIEFNWPQHHRPTTFMPVNYFIKNNDDGSSSVFVGESEAMFGLKHTTEIKLYADKSYIEISTDVYNRGELPQTFLWWANPAYRVNNDTATIMPVDVTAVMDHGKRAVSTFPIATGEYYKMDYSKGVDISRYKNIPVPTSFMAYKSDFDFIGGYDYGKKAGLLHVADHHVSPGKKQWTWGSGDFGIAWDRNLTDEDGPYVELMTGCFTDNQPDFTFINPHETKSFTQYFMPYHEVGRILNADKNICFGVENGVLIVFSSVVTNIDICIEKENKIIYHEMQSFNPCESKQITKCDENCVITLTYDNNKLVFDKTKVKKFDVPEPATACPPPSECKTLEELYLFGTHIEQYRHATRLAEDYYLEGLKRDSEDIRLNNAYGALLLRRGSVAESVPYFEKAIAKSNVKNTNPKDTEAYFNLAVAQFNLGNIDEAYDNFYKCAWGNDSVRAFYYLAVIDKIKGNIQEAIQKAKRAVVACGNDTRALNTLGRLYKEIGKTDDAKQCFERSQAIDELDVISAFELGKLDKIKTASASEIRVICSDYLYEQNYIRLKEFLNSWKEVTANSDCLIEYYIAYANKMLGEDFTKNIKCAEKEFEKNVCFANSLADIKVLKELDKDNNYIVSYLLGNAFYDKKNYDLAAKYWLKSCDINNNFATSKRNLALYFYNKKQDAALAFNYMQEAFNIDKNDARILLELFELYVLIGKSKEEQFELLQSNLKVVEQRDDLYLYYLTALLQKGVTYKTYNLLMSRKFHPWEGGEGKVTKLYKQLNIALAEIEDKNGDYDLAKSYFEKCFVFPENLGEGKLILDYDNDIYFMLGELAEKYGHQKDAEKYYEMATRGQIKVLDNMYYNDNPIDYVYYAAKAYKKLGIIDKTEIIKQDLLNYYKNNINKKAVIDYFAVSLPDMLIWEQDIDKRNKEFCEKVLQMANSL